MCQPCSPTEELYVGGSQVGSGLEEEGLWCGAAKSIPGHAAKLGLLWVGCDTACKGETHEARVLGMKGLLTSAVGEAVRERLGLFSWGIFRSSVRRQGVQALRVRYVSGLRDKSMGHGSGPPCLSASVGVSSAPQGPAT